MIVRIRLSRIGKKNAPAYRIVVAPQRSSRGGKAIEIIGNYNPSHNPAQLTIKKDRLAYWVEKGAQMSDAVKQLNEGNYKYSVYYGANSGAKKS